MTGRVLVFALLVASCSAPTADDKGRLIQGALTAGKAACVQLLTDPSIPRDQEATEYCLRLVNQCREVPQ